MAYFILITLLVIAVYIHYKFVNRCKMTIWVTDRNTHNELYKQCQAVITALQAEHKYIYTIEDHTLFGFKLELMLPAYPADEQRHGIVKTILKTVENNTRLHPTIKVELGSTKPLRLD